MIWISNELVSDIFWLRIDSVFPSDSNIATLTVWLLELRLQSCSKGVTNFCVHPRTVIFAANKYTECNMVQYRCHNGFYYIAIECFICKISTSYHFLNCYMWYLNWFQRAKGLKILNLCFCQQYIRIHITANWKLIAFYVTELATFCILCHSDELQMPTEFQYKKFSYLRRIFWGNNRIVTEIEWHSSVWFLVCFWKCFIGGNGPITWTQKNGSSTYWATALKMEIW